MPRIFDNIAMSLLPALQDTLRISERAGRKAYQSQLDFGGGKIFLLRAIVDEATDPAIVITVYRTRKIGKYWRAP
jgi:hypothetical protein